MKQLFKSSLVALFYSLIASTVFAQQIQVPLIPTPASMQWGEGTFTFTTSTSITVENESQTKIVQEFITLFTHAAGFTPKIQLGGKKGDIRLFTDNTLKNEAYRLEITPQKITIHASGSPGFFYALQSIRQLLPAAIEQDNLALGIDWKVPAVTIVDEPRFGYRGVMIDVARFFTPKRELLRIIDCMAMLKLNTLHFHLTDDNGWRIEIKKYPLLTEIGSQQVERPGKLFPERLNARQGEPTIPKGYYTQEDIREIVAYAATRQIEVIPELEMPAHSNAALAAYPLLTCPIIDKYIGVLPGLGGTHADIIYCAGNDSVFTFLEGIVDELVELFPSRYIHLGGDEARKTHWKQCPLCQKRMKDEKLEDEEALQGYFMARMSKYVQAKGREVMGWDELTNTRIPEGAIIFGWQGLGKAALKAAEQGHRFIMTPARIMYLIRYQGPQWFEPVTYFGNNTLKDVYDYEPIDKTWDSKTCSLLMGIQGSMWTEFCNKPEDVEYQLFPRMAAVAEGAWTLPARKQWPEFLKAVDRYNEHLEAKGVTYARSMYNIQHTVTPVKGKLQITLECIRPDVEIRYTTDGSEPTAKSILYKDKWVTTEAVTVKSATFKGGKQMGETLVLPVLWHKATAATVTGSTKGQVMSNGVRGSLKNSDFEWMSWDRNDTITFTLDLHKRKDIHKLTLGVMNNFGMGIHKPRAIEVTVSNDNQEYKQAAFRRFELANIFMEGTFIEDISFALTESARYVRITLHGAGKCPGMHVRSGQDARINIDEIIIE
ncbi:family 20 glycosylhydrolase [Bacteroides sp. 519]|uniref:glycoside hydrolase family 20 protein n=1 Tax=Bacteroides sp. 519 TaxID=2302937 RepID=UPI0013D752CB|nr:family 20 glycosylhydrolase [Bacteroides sp. 519]NDV57228.1 beta-hexosaminidase [Bacteroides sp. 519]